MNFAKKGIEEKFKCRNDLYIIMLIIFIIFRIVPFSSGSTMLDEALNDLFVGATASALVAWLVDLAECSRRNKELIDKEQMIFSEYEHSIWELCYKTSELCKGYCNLEQHRTIEGWLNILNSKKYYSVKKDSDSKKQNYKQLYGYVKRIHTAVILLKQQYALLVDYKIIDTEDLRQHLSVQDELCYQFLEVMDSTLLFNRHEKAKNLLVQIVTNYFSYFEDCEEITFSCTDLKG